MTIKRSMASINVGQKGISQMCGYCIESNFLSFVKLEHHGIFQFIESTNAQEPIVIEPFFMTHYLQDFDDLIGVIHNTSWHDKFQYGIDIVFCRLYEEYINNGFNYPLFELIRSVFERDCIDSFFSQRKECCHNELWSELGNESLYNNEDSWNKFIADKECLAQSAINILSLHCDRLIKGREANKVDPVYFLPVLYFSLSFLCRHFSDTEIIKIIALTYPCYTPHVFDANELWLQRKALLHCVKKYGVAFLVDHFKTIKYELIFYVLSKLKMSRKDLHTLKTLITSENETIYFGMLPEEVLALIEELEQQE